MGTDLLSEICRSFVPGLPCQHPGFIGPLCTRCGRDKLECGDPPTTPFSYIEPGLTLTMPEIDRLRNVNLKTLIGRKKLHLVLDLDNSLVHSTLSRNLTLEERDHLINKYATKGLLSEVCDGVMVVKLRPGAREFLEKASAMFDLSVFTKGRRDYAEEVARVLDPDGSRFGQCRWRIMSREDCFMGTQKRLDVVLAHDRVVLIVDDNEEVWADDNKGNLIKIAPYRFFSPRKNLSEAVKCGCRFEDNEAKEEGEFARVLNTLKEVHGTFYEDSFMVEYGHVRHLLKKVM